MELQKKYLKANDIYQKFFNQIKEQIRVCK